MKQITDLMYYRLNGQPDSTATTYNCQLSPLCRICNPTPMNSGFAIHTATNLLRRAFLVLTLLAGWGMSSVAQETNLWTGPGTETNIASTAFGSFEVSTDVFRVYTDNNPIHIRTTWWNSVLLSNETTFQPNGSYYITDLNCYEIPLSAFVNDFVNKINTEGGLVVGTENGGTINGITLFTPQKDNFINEAVSNCATTSGSEEIARDLATKTINLSGASLTGVNYARIYLANANGNAVDPTGLLTVTYNSTAATAAGTNVKNGVYVYDSGNLLDLSNVSVTLNAGAGNFTNYQIVCLLSNDMSTATFTGGDLTQEPKWQEEYTYTFTYPIYVQTFTLDESVLTGNDIVIDNNSQYCNQILSFFGKTAAQMASSWYGRWYVTNASGTIQTLNLGTSASSNWTIAPRFENNAYNTWEWNMASNMAYTHYNADWYVNQALCRARVFAPSSGTFDNYQGYRIVFEATDEYTSGTPAMKLRYIFVIPSTAHFEYDGTITNGTTPVIQTLPSRLASEVTLDWTSTTATSAMTTTGVKYARFYVVDDNDTPVDATDNAHKLTITGATATPCVNPASGYYVYPGSDGNIDFSNLSVKLSASSTAALLGYKVKCWLATATTGIVLDGSTVTEEPDITNEYVYSFTKPAPTTVDKTGTIAWGASMQADASDGAPADWGTTWAELSHEQRVVWYVTDGTSKQQLALGTAAQSGAWVLGLPTDKFSVSGNEAELSGQTTFTATEWNTWGKPAIYAPSDKSFAEVHGYNVVCEVYETATGTTPNVRYTFSFTKDFLGELKSGVTATTQTVTLANATDVSGTLSDVTIPAGTKYVRFYLTDASDNVVDPTGKLSVSGSTNTVPSHAEYGYYIYNNVGGITAPTVTLTLSDATLNQYKVVMVTSTDDAVTDGSNNVVNEPDYDTQTTWSFKYPVQHTEATDEVEWSPASMTVPLDIDALKGAGYKAALGSNYHVVWTVEDASGTPQALTTGSSRQSGTWTYNNDGDNATFYAPSDATFSDVQNLSFVARLYETATGEDNADKSLTYTVSIGRTEFLGQQKNTFTSGSETVLIEDANAASVDVPLSHATLTGAKYARVWLTQNGSIVNPDGKLSLPTGMTAFGTNHDANYGYYLYDEDGITLTDVTLSAPGSYSDYQVHIALSVDAPFGIANFARAGGPLRATSLTAYEPDYDYEYTISFLDNSMKVIKIYAQANDGTEHGNNYNTGAGNNNEEKSIYQLVTAAFNEMVETLSASNCFVKWNVKDKNGNYVTMAQYYAGNGQVQLQNLGAYHASSDNKSVYAYYDQNAQSNASQLLDATLVFGNGVFQLGSVVELWVTNENNHTAADPADGYKVKVELYFNEDGNPPYVLLNETDIAATKKMVNVKTLNATAPVFDMTDALTANAKYARFYLMKLGSANAASENLVVTYNGNPVNACPSPYGRFGHYLSVDGGIELSDLQVSVNGISPDDMLQYQLVVVSSDNALTGTQEPAWQKMTVISFQKDIKSRIFGNDTNTSISNAELSIGDNLLQADVLNRLGAVVADISGSLYAKWYVLAPDGTTLQALAGRNGAYGNNATWGFNFDGNGNGRWENINQVYTLYTDMNAYVSSQTIAQSDGNGLWNNQIARATQIYVPCPDNDEKHTLDYPGYQIVFELSDEYDPSTDGVDPGYKLKYIWTITDPKDFVGHKNTDAAEEEVTQIVNRDAESINLTLQGPPPTITWALDHEKLRGPENEPRYARFYLTDAEGNAIDPTGKLTVTYGGNNATVTTCSTPEYGFYIFGEGGNVLQKPQINVSLAAPKEYMLYKVVCVFSNELSEIIPEGMTLPLTREPDYDLKYTYSFFYNVTTQEKTATIDWKNNEPMLAHAEVTDPETEWNTSWTELSTSQYVRWYVVLPGYMGNQKQQVAIGNSRQAGKWTLDLRGLPFSVSDDGTEIVLTDETVFNANSWKHWGKPDLYAPTGMTYQGTMYSLGGQYYRLICEVAATDDATPYVRYTFGFMNNILGELKANGSTGEEIVKIEDLEATSVSVPLNDALTAFNDGTAHKTIYARVWLTTNDGTRVDPSAISWTQEYNGNQVVPFSFHRDAWSDYGYYWGSLDVGQHTTGIESLNDATLTLPAGTFTQYQVHVALSTSNPTEIYWNGTRNRWEFSNENTAGGWWSQPVAHEPDYDYVYTFKFRYNFEAKNIDDPELLTKYMTLIYDEDNNKCTPTILNNWPEVVGDTHSNRQDLADKGYVRWYLINKETGDPIQMLSLQSQEPYHDLESENGYWRKGFNIEYFKYRNNGPNTQYNPTIQLPVGVSYKDVRVVCVVTTLTDDFTFPEGDEPLTKEPEQMQVKYIYDLMTEAELQAQPFIHYHGVHYPTYHYHNEHSREFVSPDLVNRNLLPAEGTYQGTTEEPQQLVWDYGRNTLYDPADNSYEHYAYPEGDSPDYSTRNIRQKTHIEEYHMYLNLTSGQTEALYLPFENYKPAGMDGSSGDGSDTEPMGYIRWYDWNTDLATDNLVKVGEKLNETNRGLMATMIDANPVHLNVGVEFKAPAGFENWTDDQEITIACDVSRYMDGMDDSKQYLVHEPTLSMRYIYHIKPAKIMADKMVAGAQHFNEVMAQLKAGANPKDIADYSSRYHLLEYNGRTVISLNNGVGDFSMRCGLSTLEHYFVYGNNGELVPCNYIRWYAYHEDEEGVWYRRLDMGERAGHRLASYTMQGFSGVEYTSVADENVKKTVTLGDGDRVQMIAYIGHGDYDTPTEEFIPVVSTELNIIYEKPLTLEELAGRPDRTYKYMLQTFAGVSPAQADDMFFSGHYPGGASMHFDDFFDDPAIRYKKPTNSWENYAKIPVKFADAEYGFCYPQLYGQCATSRYIRYADHWRGFGQAPLHGDYILLKSMNLEGVSETRQGDDEHVEVVLNKQSMYALWFLNDPLFDVSHERHFGKETGDEQDYGAFLYVDAADEARTIGLLEFDANLCAGAEIYYTAYIASMTDAPTQPRVRFHVYTYNTDTGYPLGYLVNGVETKLLEGQTEEKRVPVVSFSTGDISTTRGADYDQHTWYQVYGHTLIPAELNYLLYGLDRHFFVDIDNYSLDTKGADYCVDEISFFTSSAKVKAEASTDVCADGNGVEVTITAEADKWIGYFTTNELVDLYYRIYEYSNDPDHQIQESEALTGPGVYKDDDQTYEGNQYATVSFRADYDMNTIPTWEEFNASGNTTGYYKKDGVAYFQFARRFFQLKPDREYFVSFYTLEADKVGDLSGWGSPYGANSCTVYSNTLTAGRMFTDLLEGENDEIVSDHTINFGCDITDIDKDYLVKVRYPTDQGYHDFTDITFDFFVGDGQTLYEAVDDQGTYLLEALESFRYHADCQGSYASVSDLPTTYAIDQTTTNYLNCIKYFMVQGKLSLDNSNKFTHTFHLKEGRPDDSKYEENYMAIPVPKELQLPDGAYGSICSPIEVYFIVDPKGAEPKLELGFDDVRYPDDYYKRVVRLGLEQLNNMRKRNNGYSLHIPVSRYTDKSGGNTRRLLFLDKRLTLSATDDPSIKLEGDGAITDRLVAEITGGHDDEQTVYVSASRMYLPLDFSKCSTEITFHEGYSYEILTNYYDEEDPVDEENACHPELFIVLKVVPEFATWHAQPIEYGSEFHNVNWYNDGNWQRSTRDDLYKDANGTNATQNTHTLGHPDGYDNNGEGSLSQLIDGVNPGFVPMKFTYVTMAGGSESHAPDMLKLPTDKGSVQQGGNLISPVYTEMLSDTSPFDNTKSSHPTDYIRYDMLVRYGSHAEGGEGCFGHRFRKVDEEGEWSWFDDSRTPEQMEEWNTNRHVYDCEKFYGNICKEIYFKPGAEILRQQRLNYNRAWVERELTANKWYLVSSPLKDTYAGDMYVPTTMSDLSMETPADKAGRQMTEAFQPIIFSTTAVNADADHTVTSQPAYSRTKYPIYQRSWNKEGSKVYTRTNDARRTDYSANLNYDAVTSVATEWSHTYNDVQVPYTTLTGFSVRANRKDQKDGSSNDVPALLRLPKADTQYDYYQWDNTSPADGKLTHDVTRTTTPTSSYPLPSRYAGGITDNYRLVVDDPEADGEFSVNIDNLQQQDGYIIVGNPYMASLRMDEFFKGNPGLAPSYWTYNGSEASAELTAPVTITASAANDNEKGIIRPLQAFFVKKKTTLGDGEAEATSIAFYRSMTTDGNFPPVAVNTGGNGGEGTGNGDGGSRLLKLRAASGQGGSSAVLRLNTEADDDYHEGEDVETLFDSNLADVPMVYTVAGGQAVSIDQRPSLDLVSFGVVQAQDKPVQVTLNTQQLTSNTQHLYFIDALTGEQTQVTDGTTLTVQPNDYGRYFLSTTAVQSISAKEQSIIISVRQQEVTVTANGGQLKMVRATSLNGITAYNGDAGLSTQCRFQLPKGVYIIQASTDDGTQRQLKVVVE